jgi:hypothetical protein
MLSIASIKIFKCDKSLRTYLSIWLRKWREIERLRKRERESYPMTLCIYSFYRFCSLSLPIEVADIAGKRHLSLC